VNCAEVNYVTQSDTNVHSDLHVNAIKATNYTCFSVNITDLKLIILYRVYKTGKHKCRKRGGGRSRRRITRKTNKNVDMDWKHDLQRFGNILLIHIYKCMLFLGME
jgi:hypothetical protein